MMNAERDLCTRGSSQVLSTSYRELSLSDLTPDHDSPMPKEVYTSHRAKWSVFVVFEIQDSLPEAFLLFLGVIVVPRERSISLPG